MSTFEKRWSDTDIAKVRELRDQRMPASHIAARMGTTRNAIMGLCWREGIVSTPKPGKPKPETACNGHAARNARARAKGAILSPVATPPRPIPVRAFQASAKRAPIGIMELTHCTCRWPAPPKRPDGPMRYCGSPAMDVGPNSTKNHKRSHSKPPTPQSATPTPTPPLFNEPTKHEAFLKVAAE